MAKKSSGKSTSKTKTQRKTASASKSKKASASKASKSRKSSTKAKKSASRSKRSAQAGKASAKKTAKKTSTKKASSPGRKVKSPLTKKELGEFRKMLIEKRRELIGDMNGIEADALGKDRQDDRPESFNMPTHPADVGTDNYEQEFTLGLLESERILLQEINDALERIEHKTFGVCLGTGDPIGLPRLRARPWSKYCIEYQRQLEKGLARPVEDEDDEHAYGGLDEEEDEEDIEDSQEQDDLEEAGEEDQDVEEEDF